MFQSAGSSCARNILITFSVTAILAQTLILLDFGDTNANNLHRPGSMGVVFFAAEFAMAFFIMVACVTHSIWRNIKPRSPAEDEESLLAISQEDDTEVDGFSLVDLRGGQPDRSATPERLPSVTWSVESDRVSQVETCNDSLDSVSDKEEEDPSLYEVLFTPEDIQLLQFAGFDLGSIGLETMREQC